MAQSSHFERSARAVKVAGYLRALSKLEPHPTADEMLAWGSSTWDLLARFAGVNPPGSQATIDATIQAVRAREAVSA